MDATLYTILERAREQPSAFASIEHFTLNAGQSASPQILIDEPGWSPYCLDDANRRVLFVYTPPEVDLSQAAFVYTAQFEHAQRAMTVSYSDMQRLTESIQPPETLIFLYSTGRCGSTLMSKVFSQVGGVYGLSEPDIYTNLSFLRAEQGRDTELVQVMKSCTLLLCAGKKAAAIKFRSHALGVAHWLHAAFPAAHSIFMYRNALSWAKSFHRFLQRLGFPSQVRTANAPRLWATFTGEDSAYLEPYLDTDSEMMYFSDFLGLLWARYLDLYMTAYERGIPFHTVRYEDLTAQREATLKAVFDYCGLPDSGMEQAIQVFEVDSQEGTAIARDVQADDLPPERVEQFLATLARHPHFNQPDFILPERPQTAS